MSAGTGLTDALTAWVRLLQSKAAITAIVPGPQIGYDITIVNINLESNWIIVASQGIRMEKGFWEGIIQLNFLAPHGHLAEQIQRTVITELADPLLNFRVHRIESGTQEGAVVSVADVYALHRGSMPVVGNIEYPFRSCSIRTKVSVERMAWT